MAPLVAAGDEGQVGGVMGDDSPVFDLRRMTQETTYQQLIDLPEAELRRRFDVLLSMGFHELTADHYRDEIQRRETAKQNRRLELLTWALVALTVVLAMATVVLVWIELRPH